MRLIIALTCVVLSQPAFADEARVLEQAKKLYTDGMKHYNLADYAPALDEFKRAYFAKPDAAFLFNIAQCQRQLGDYEAAAKSYRAFVRESKDLAATTREEVQRLIGEMDKAINEACAKKPPTGTRPTSEIAPVPTPTPEPPVPQPAPPPVVPPSATRDVEARPTPWFKNAIGWSLVGAGVAALGAGGGLWGAAGSVDGGTTLGDRIAATDTANTYRTAGYVLVGVGAASAVAGAITFVVMARPKRGSLRVSLGGGR